MMMTLRGAQTVYPTRFWSEGVDDGTPWYPSRAAESLCSSHFWQGLNQLFWGSHATTAAFLDPAR
jgi:hypothetical protein